MPDRPLTTSPVLSRRAALTGAGLGAFAVLAGPVVPALALAPAGSPGGSTTSLPLGSGGGSTGVRSLLAAASGDSVVALEVSGGSMVGVSFPAGTAARSVDLRVRRTGGGWGPWTTLEVGDGAPDDDRPGDGPGTVVATDPVWTGDLSGGATVQVRLPAAAAATAHLQVVDPGTGVAAPSPARSGALAVSTLDAQVPDGTDATSASVPTPRIRSRAEWGADESLRRNDPSYSETIKACVVHHTADGGSYSQSEVPAVIRGMYRYHTVSLGWSDLGYNFVVDRFGGIWEGRAGGTTRAVVGAHAGGFNTDTFGVSMMGDFTSVAPSDACLQSVAAVIAWKFARYDLRADGRTSLTSAGGGTSRYAAGETVDLRTVNAHRDVGFTACPGNVGFTRMDDVRARVAALLGPSAGSGTAISRKYAAVDGTALLGRATSTEGDALDGGRYRHYAEGSIYDHPGTGTHVVRGATRTTWSRLGWEWSVLGFPTTDTTPVDGGAFTHFQGGSIYRADGGPAVVVRGAIRATWASLGWERSGLGWPTSDEYDVPGGRRSDFAGGSLTWDARTGAVTQR